MADARTIARNVADVLSQLPPGVLLVAAVKSRTADEVRAALDAGVEAIGHNYVQEAEAMAPLLADRPVQWRFIGRLQRNKAKRAAALFDAVDTVDSLRLAAALDRCAAEAGKVLPVLIEVNSAGEPNKSGVLPEEAEGLARAVAALPHLRLEGLMTMGPLSAAPEALRPYFRMTRDLFDRLAALRLPGAAMSRLSMGMSDSWRIAIEEGANVVRLGTRLFGPR